jgi:hypothetical protein
MTYYDTFDSKIQCEEMMEVSPEEYAEVMREMAEVTEASEGFGWWSAGLEEPEKDWLGTYTNSTEGPSYNGIDI